jgi:prepilin-type N-terminal cleavage/methylation domain-containing protein
MLRAFTVLELLVAISILAIIVFALYQMFHQTQKAMRGNVTQVDVMESGRAAMEMMARELSQIAPCKLQGATNLYLGLFPPPPLAPELMPPAPFMQLEMGGTAPLRTNMVHQFLFLRPQTNQWFATGYRVIGADGGVGTLYRFSLHTNMHRLNAVDLTAPFWRFPITNAITRRVSTNYHRVADGVVHLRLTAYDFEGRRMGYDTTNGLTSYRVFQPSVANNPNVIMRQEVPGQSQMIFLNDAVPAALEIDIRTI